MQIRSPVVNDERFIRRSEIIWEKGTNRAEFYRGMVNKYGWCDMGSSFLPSEFNAAYLWAQLEQLFYLLCPSLDYRTKLMGYLKEKGIQTTFHYLPLHSSAYYQDKHDGRVLVNCDRYGDTLVRLPLFYELTDDEVNKIVDAIVSFKA